MNNYVNKKIIVIDGETHNYIITNQLIYECRNPYCVVHYNL